MVNSNMSRILMGSSVERREEKKGNNLVDTGKVSETLGHINTLKQLYSANNAF